MTSGVEIIRRRVVGVANRARKVSTKHVFEHPRFAGLDETTKEEIARFINIEFDRLQRRLAGELAAFLREIGG